jgi:hypothetical protein
MGMKSLRRDNEDVAFAGGCGSGDDLFRGTKDSGADVFHGSRSFLFLVPGLFRMPLLERYR